MVCIPTVAAQALNSGERVAKVPVGLPTGGGVGLLVLAELCCGRAQFVDVPRTIGGADSWIERPELKLVCGVAGGVVHGGAQIAHGERLGRFELCCAVRLSAETDQRFENPLP